MKIFVIFVFAACIAVSYSAPGILAVDWEAAEDKADAIGKNVYDGFQSMRGLCYADKPHLAVKFDSMVNYTIERIDGRVAALQEHISSESLLPIHAQDVMAEIKTFVSQCQTVFTYDYTMGFGENFSRDTISGVFGWFGGIMDRIESDFADLRNLLIK